MKRLACFLMAWAVGCEPPPVPGADWPQLQGDATRTGRNPLGASEAIKPRWLFKIPREGIARGVQPIVYQGKVFFGSRQGTFRCVDAAAGTELWQIKTVGSVDGTAAAHGDSVFFGSTDGNLYAAEIASGKTRWKFEAGRPGFSAALLATDGKIYVGSRDGRFFCLAQADGKLHWWQQTGGPILQAACYGPAGTESEGTGRVFVGSEDMIFHAWDADSGKPLWESEPLPGMGFAAPMVAWPVYVQGRVLVHVCPYDDLFKGPKLSKTLDPQRDAQYEELWKIFDANRRPQPTEADLAAFSDQISAWIQKYPEWQTFFVFDAASGRQPYVAPVVYTGHSGTSYPPVLDPQGKVTIMCCVPVGAGTNREGSFLSGAYAVMSLPDGKLTELRRRFDFYHTHNITYGRTRVYHGWSYFCTWRNIFSTPNVYGRGDFMAGWTGIAVGDRYVAMNRMDVIYCAEGR